MHPSINRPPRPAPLQAWPCRPAFARRRPMPFLFVASRAPGRTRAAVAASFLIAMQLLRREHGHHSQVVAQVCGPKLPLVAPLAFVAAAGLAGCTDLAASS